MSRHKTGTLFSEKNKIIIQNYILLRLTLKNVTLTEVCKAHDYNYNKMQRRLFNCKYLNLDDVNLILKMMNNKTYFKVIDDQLFECYKSKLSEI